MPKSKKQSAIQFFEEYKGVYFNYKEDIHANENNFEFNCVKCRKTLKLNFGNKIRLSHTFKCFPESIENFHVISRGGEQQGKIAFPKEGNKKDNTLICNAMYELFTSTHLPIYLVENQAFQQSYKCLSNINYKFPSRRTLTRRIAETAEQYRDLMETALQRAMYYSLYMDGWSKNWHQFLVLYVLLMRKNKENKIITQFCPLNIIEEYSSTADGLTQIVQDEGLESKKLVIISTDNTAGNLKFLQLMSEQDQTFENFDRDEDVISINQSQSVSDIYDEDSFSQLYDSYFQEEDQQQVDEYDDDYQDIPDIIEDNYKIFGLPCPSHNINLFFKELIGMDISKRMIEFSGLKNNPTRWGWVLDAYIKADTGKLSTADTEAHSEIISTIKDVRSFIGDIQTKKPNIQLLGQVVPYINYFYQVVSSEWRSPGAKRVMKQIKNSMIKGNRMQRITENPILNLAAFVEEQDEDKYNRTIALQCAEELKKRFIVVERNFENHGLKNPRQQVQKKQKVEIDYQDLLQTILPGGNASLEQEFSLFKFIQEGRRNRLTTQNLKNRIFAKYELLVKNFLKDDD